MGTEIAEVDVTLAGRDRVATVAPATRPAPPAGLRRHEEASAFRLAAAIAAAVGPESDEGRKAAGDAGAHLLALAASGDARSLGEVLRPDPERPADTFTIACYQIGDLSPSALRDFVDPVEALSLLGRCADPSHVAAELVVSNDDGLRWTAATRTGEQVRFQLPPTGSADPGHPAASARWDDRLVSWAADPEQEPAAPPTARATGGVDALVVDAGLTGAVVGPIAREGQPGGLQVQVVSAPDPRVEELLARIARLEAQLATGVAGGRWEQIGRQVDAVVDIWRRTRR
ncbi:MAG TPA: hypothetical protein VFP61_03040 [Acidimicrobiales bacterium]|nr:hypothetical protein [Acidimicrobiales bacterium]